MKPGGGKSKGAEFERVICKQLGKWVTNDERDDIFWRSAGSGSRATIQNKKGLSAAAQSGDITSTHWLGSYLTERFSLECKTYQDLGVTSSLTKRKGQLIDFWKQTVRDGIVNYKLPLLIAKQARHPILLCVCEKGKKILQLHEIALLIPLGTLHPVGLPILHIYNFEEFIEQADASVLELQQLIRRKRVQLI